MWSHESGFAFAVAGTVTLLFACVLALTKGNSLVVFALPLLTVFLISVSSFRLSSIILVISLFLDFQLIAFSAAVWCSLLFGLSFAITHPNFRWRDFSTPVNWAIVTYGLLILPSFMYVARPMVSFFMLFNVVAFLIVMYSVAAGVREYSDFTWIMVVYFLLVLLDSVDVIQLSLTGKARPFGFAGVWFVDYSALAICLSAVIAFITRGWRRYLLFTVGVFVTVGLILTQTRNTWVSGIITLSILTIYILIHPDIVALTRRKIIVSFLSGAVFLGGIAFAVSIFNPRIERRVEQLTSESSVAIDQEGFVENSFVSRALIWDTALNAFRAHPLVGIGVYAFKYASHEYSTLPELLYYRYVVYRSAHQTQLAVLAETGIIGFIGFSIFLVTLLRHSFRSIRLAASLQGKRYALGGAISVVYCTVSMVFTDAWLWGQQIILLGIVCGSVFAIRRLNAVEHNRF